jgi:hypothetical protein
VQQMGNNIRLFEPVVILSLKKYVNSNETEFETTILDLFVTYNYFYFVLMTVYWMLTK